MAYPESAVEDPPSVRDSRLASSEARRQPSVAPCSGWSRPSRLRRWAAASLDHPLRAAPSKMAGRDGETARLCQTEKLLVDHISRLRALCLGTAVINVLDGEIELVFVALGAAKFGAAIGEHPRRPDA